MIHYSYFGVICISGSFCSAATLFQLAFPASSQVCGLHCAPKFIQEALQIYHAFLIAISTDFLVSYTVLQKS